MLHREASSILWPRIAAMGALQHSIMDYMMLLWLPAVLYLLFAGTPIHPSLWMSGEIDTGSSEVCTHDRVVGSAGSRSGSFQTFHLQSIRKSETEPWVLPIADLSTRIKNNIAGI